MSLLRQAYRIVHSEGILAFLASIYRFLGWEIERFLRVMPWTPNILFFYISVCHNLMPGKYSDADPFKIIWVDPSKVKTNSISATKRSFGRVYGGEWDDMVNDDSENHARIQSIVDHFVNGTVWRDTDYYKEWLRRTKSDAETAWFGCKTEVQIHKKLEAIDRLYACIKSSGYKLQTQISSESYGHALWRCNDAPHPFLNEIGVNIGRNGEFIFRCSGLHRLAIAKSLSLKEVPVQVRVRHHEWQRIRDEIISTNVYDCLSERSKKYISHPDLQDIAYKYWRSS